MYTDVWQERPYMPSIHLCASLWVYRIKEPVCCGAEHTIFGYTKNRYMCSFHCWVEIQYKKLFLTILYLEWSPSLLLSLQRKDVKEFNHFGAEESSFGPASWWAAVCCCTSLMQIVTPHNYVWLKFLNSVWGFECCRSPFSFIDDNVKHYRAHIVDDFLAEEDIRRIDWHVKSLDLHPAEHAWDGLERATVLHHLLSGNSRR